MKQIKDYIKAARRGSREAEIEMYGKPLNHRRVVKSKKQYDRKKIRANDRKRHSPDFLSVIWSRGRYTPYEIVKIILCRTIVELVD